MSVCSLPKYNGYIVITENPEEHSRKAQLILQPDASTSRVLQTSRGLAMYQWNTVDSSHHSVITIAEIEKPGRLSDHAAVFHQVCSLADMIVPNLISAWQDLIVNTSFHECTKKLGITNTLPLSVDPLTLFFTSTPVRNTLRPQPVLLSIPCSLVGGQQTNLFIPLAWGEWEQIVTKGNLKKLALAGLISAHQTQSVLLL
jgi:hypothetical protein